MTIDEAIKHCEGFSEAHDKLRKICDDASGFSISHNESIRTSEAKEHEKCSQDFRQLVGWLKELKALKAEPCENSISRKAVDNLVDELARAISDERCHISRGRSYGEIMQDILDLPSITPKQKTGKWNVLGYDDPLVRFYKCSECHAKITLKFNYCPHCGAKMESEE